MPDIVLATLNAKYIHAAFGLRYLLANLGELQSRACLVEFDIHQRPLDITEVLLARNPKIIGLGVYIWNVTETTQVVAALKRVRPDVLIILGGPEVSYETESQEIVRLADHVITGEADVKFAEVCRGLLGAKAESPPKIIPAPLPDLATLVLPYGLYSEDDIAHRVIYVEASRGCPFTCEFCLSSLDLPVRQFPLPPLLQELDGLLARGVRRFKFVDRTFNLNLNVSRALLQFFHERLCPGLFLHFEMIPDRLPAALRELIQKFPPGALQFEVGIQTFDDTVAQNISRRQDYEKLADNFKFLRDQTGVHIHADLIIGLPGETMASFGAGFDRLVALRPQEIQVGILKRLRGTPIVRHDAEWQMIYGANPPYEILQNRRLDFGTFQRLRRFARYWDLVANSGNFIGTTPMLWPGGTSPFAAFLKFSDWLFGQVGRQHGIALAHLAELLFTFLTGALGQDPKTIAQSIWRDYQGAGRRDPPVFLEPHLPKSAPGDARLDRSLSLKRQARHQAPHAGYPVSPTGIAGNILRQTPNLGSTPN